MKFDKFVINDFLQSNKNGCKNLDDIRAKMFDYAYYPTRLP